MQRFHSRTNPTDGGETGLDKAPNSRCRTWLRRLVGRRWALVAPASEGGLSEGCGCSSTFTPWVQGSNAAPPLNTGLVAASKLDVGHRLDGAVLSNVDRPVRQRPKALDHALDGRQQAHQACVRGYRRSGRKSRAEFSGRRFT